MESFKNFNRLYRLGEEVQTEGDIEGKLNVLAAKDDDEGAIMIVSRDFEGKLEIAISGNYKSCVIKRVDDNTSDGTANICISDKIPLTGNDIEVDIKKSEMLHISCV